jgi:NhaC family Na+:H+ antiporter
MAAPRYSAAVGAPKPDHQQAGSQQAEAPPPPLWISLVPVLALIAALYLSVVHFRKLGLTSHTPLVLASIVAAFVALRLGLPWKRIEQAMVHGISLALAACLILMVIGMLVATWIQAGIVPAMIYYGLDLLSPAIFLVATTVICALVSLATGSSWSTAATVGIALIGMGEGLGLPRARVAGAIVSGAYFGDKMSPLSDTTNLAPAVAGANLFDHIRHMATTSGPSLIIALVIYATLGGGEAAEGTQQVDALRTTLAQNYDLSPWLLLPPLLVIAMVVARIPALPAICGGWLLGGLLALIAQATPLGQVLKVSFSGVVSKSGNKLVDSLLSRGGLSSMLSTVALVTIAMCFGGVMESAGMLGTLAANVLSLARGDGGLVLATVVTCLGMNVLASDQYLAVVVPGRMYRQAYADRGLAAKNLSRALEDSGTITSPLIPWNTCGAYMIATLGVAPWSYVPYAFLNLLNPLISVFYGYTGLTMTRIAPSEIKTLAGDDAPSDEGDEA